MNKVTNQQDIENSILLEEVSDLFSKENPEINDITKQRKVSNSLNPRKKQKKISTLSDQINRLFSTSSSSSRTDSLANHETTITSNTTKSNSSEGQNMNNKSPDTIESETKSNSRRSSTASNGSGGIWWIKKIKKARMSILLDSGRVEAQFLTQVYDQKKPVWINDSQFIERDIIKEFWKTKKYKL